MKDGMSTFSNWTYSLPFPIFHILVPIVVNISIQIQLGIPGMHVEFAFQAAKKRIKNNNNSSRMKAKKRTKILFTTVIFM